MKSRTTKLLIVFLNLILIGFLSYTIYDEYVRIGKFQWIDSNAVEDNEEFLITPISAIIISFGCINLLYEILPILKINIRKLILVFLRRISYLYGSFLIFISAIFILLTLINIGNHDYNMGFILNVSIFLFALLSIGFLGGLIIYNEKKSIT